MDGRESPMPGIKKQNTRKKSITDKLYAPKFTLKTRTRRKPRFAFSADLRFVKVPLLLGLPAALILWLSLSQNAADMVTYFQRTISHKLAKNGFSVQKINLMGHLNTKEDRILRSIRLEKTLPIFDIDLPKSRETLERLPWIRSAVIRRQLPDTVHIRLVEKLPIALFQRNKKLILVDDKGQTIENCSTEHFHHLPVIVGESAMENFPTLLRQLSHYPELQNRLTGAVYMGKRRWDLILDGHLKVKLPEEKTDEAFAFLDKLDKEKQLTRKDISTIDLRLSDRMYLYLKPETMKKINAQSGKRV